MSWFFFFWGGGGWHKDPRPSRVPCVAGSAQGWLLRHCDDDGRSCWWPWTRCVRVSRVITRQRARWRRRRSSMTSGSRSISASWRWSKNCTTWYRNTSTTCTVVSVRITWSASSMYTTFPLHCQLNLIDRLRATRWTPPDYWQTDNSNGLVMIIRNYHWLNSASQVPISTCSAPLVQTGERKQTHTVWPWPLATLTYNHRLAKVKIDPRAKNQDQRSPGQTGERPQINGRTHTHTHATHGRYQTYYLPCYVVDRLSLIHISEPTRPY